MWRAVAAKPRMRQISRRLVDQQASATWTEILLSDGWSQTVGLGRATTDETQVLLPASEMTLA